MNQHSTFTHDTNREEAPTIVMRHNLLHALAEYAESKPRREQVAVLRATAKEGSISITGIVPLQNRARSAHQFIVRRDELKGASLLFHSHTRAHGFSAQDYARIALSPIPWLLAYPVDKASPVSIALGSTHWGFEAATRHSKQATCACPIIISH